jgi:drug/metabolite transporter (DMT)-like permease
VTLDDRFGYRTGFLLVAASAVAWSTAGFFTRLIELDAWTILFWRGIFGGIFILIFAIIQMRGEAFRSILSMGRYGWLTTICSTIGMLVFIPALKQTSVANVAIIYATVPFVAGALAWICFRETTPYRTLAASAVAIGGVVFVVGGSSMGAHQWGNLLAFAMTFSMAAMMVMIRRHQSIPLLPMAFLSNFLCSAIVWPFATLNAPALVDFTYLALFSFVQMTLGLMLLSIGSRMIPSAQVGLISALETPLAPLWVWIAFGEVPLPAIMIGGGIVMVAVSAHILTEYFRDLSKRQKRKLEIINAAVVGDGRSNASALNEVAA